MRFWQLTAQSELESIAQTPDTGMMQTMSHEKETKSILKTPAEQPSAQEVTETTDLTEVKHPADLRRLLAADQHKAMMKASASHVDGQIVLSILSIASA